MIESHHTSERLLLGLGHCINKAGFSAASMEIDTSHTVAASLSEWHRSFQCSAGGGGGLVLDANVRQFNIVVVIKQQPQRHHP